MLQLSGHADHRLFLGIGSGWWVTQFQASPLPVGELKLQTFLPASSWLQVLQPLQEEPIRRCTCDEMEWEDVGKGGGAHTPGSCCPLTQRNAFILFSRTVNVSPKTQGRRYKEEFSEAFEIPSCVVREVEDFCLLKTLEQYFMV